MTYYYVNRWYDEEGVPHYFGILSDRFTTLNEAKVGVRFNVIAVPVDLVYGPCTEQEMVDFLHDCNANPIDDDEEGDIGTLDWLT